MLPIREYSNQDFVNLATRYFVLNSICCTGLYYTYPKDRQEAVEAARGMVHNADAQPFNAATNGEESRGLLNADDSTGRIESQLELAPLRQEAFLTHK